MTDKTRKQMREVAARLRDPARVVTNPWLMYEDDDQPGALAEFEDGPDRACLIGHVALVADSRRGSYIELSEEVLEALTPFRMTQALEELGPAECARRIEAAAAA